MATTSRIRLGTASPASQPTVSETLVQLSALAHRAAAKGVDILLLPEAYLGGYPRGTAFGCVIGSRSDQGRDEYLSYFRGAVDLGDVVGDGGAGGGEAWVRREVGERRDGAEEERRGDGTREELERIARETGLFLVVGLVEKAGGSLYCSAVYVCPKLGAIGKRRKVLPTASERLVWAQGSPATLKAVSTTIRGVRVNLAAAICWENYMPLLRQSLYAQNINLYLAPTADMRDAWLSLMRTIGMEGRCFVVSSNMCIRDGDGLAENAVVGDDTAHGEEDDTETTVTKTPNPAGRRNSCFTKEGFEIALPSSGPGTAKSTARRQSVFDDDGNEIVLCHKDSAVSPDTAKTARRQSVFDEDGNEIVLCQKDGAVSPGTIEPEIATSRRSRLTSHMRSQAGASRTKPSFVSRGGSSIVSPFGDVLAGPQWEDDAGIIYADVDFDDCIRGRLDLDTAGSYSRNDAFKLSVSGLDLTPLPY